MIPVLLIGLGRISSLLEKDPLRKHPCTHAGTIFSPWGRKKFRLIGAIDPSPEKRDRFCKDWNIPKTECFSDFREWTERVRSSDRNVKRRNSPDAQNSKNKIVAVPIPETGSSYELRKKSPSLRGSSHKLSDKIDLPSCLVVIATPSETHYELSRDAIRFGFRHLLVEKPVCHTVSHARKLAELCRNTGADLRVNHERRYHPMYARVRRWIQNKTYGPVRTIRASVLTSARAPGRAILDKTGPLF
ncbi:gfo/Idh/MocA family oxidoreductase, partial [Leptospira gomenensis]